jgi:hypothetical protein
MKRSSPCSLYATEVEWYLSGFDRQSKSCLSRSPHQGRARLANSLGGADDWFIAASALAALASYFAIFPRIGDCSTGPGKNLAAQMICLARKSAMRSES